MNQQEESHVIYTKDFCICSIHSEKEIKTDTYHKCYLSSTAKKNVNAGRELMIAAAKVADV